MARTTFKFSRRDILALSVAAAVLPSTSSDGQAAIPPDGHDGAPRVERLARALSVALAALSGGQFGVVVRPAGYADEPVAIIDLAEAHDAAYSVSGGLVQAICGHLAAHNALGRASRAADAVRLGRKPTADELARLDHAIIIERDRLLALCRFPASNDPERFEKASYLLAHFEDADVAGEFVSAMLEATKEADSQKPPSVSVLGGAVPNERFKPALSLLAGGEGLGCRLTGAGLLKQPSDGQSENSRHSFQLGDGDVFRAPLDSSNIRPINASFQGEPLLRQAALDTKLAQIPADDLAGVHALT